MKTQKKAHLGNSQVCWGLISSDVYMYVLTRCLMTCLN